MPSAHERLLRDFEQITAEVAELEHNLETAKEARDYLRKLLRAALAGEAVPENEKPEPPIPQAIGEAINAVRHASGLVSADDVATRLNIPVSAARIRLQRARARGLLRSPKRGFYEVMPRRVDTQPDDSQAKGD